VVDVTGRADDDGLDLQGRVPGERRVGPRILRAPPQQAARIRSHR
jgi:hypothetical protein